MTIGDLMSVMQRTIFTMLMVGGPIVIAALVIGLIISVFQAATQINEATLTFVPKLIIVALVLLVLGPAMAGSLMDLTRFVFGVAVSVSPVNGG